MTTAADLPPYRPCDLCGGVDQDPRHSFSGVVPDAHPVNDSVAATLSDNLKALTDSGDVEFGQAFSVMEAFRDTTSTDRHIDCCAAAGCPLKGSDQDAAACDHRVAAANGKTGEGMRKAALSLNTEA